MKDYLFVHEGFVCESPKLCMRMALKIGLMDEFLENEMLIDAVIRNLEIIGETAAHISP